MATLIDFDIIKPETSEALKARNFFITRWVPENPGLKMDVTFVPKRKDGKPASRPRRHVVHVWEDRSSDEKYTLSIFFNQGGQSHRYLHKRGLTEEQLNEQLIGLTK